MSHSNHVNITSKILIVVIHIQFTIVGRGKQKSYEWLCHCNFLACFFDLHKETGTVRFSSRSKCCSTSTRLTLLCSKLKTNIYIYYIYIQHPLYAAPRFTLSETSHLVSSDVFKAPSLSSDLFLMPAEGQHSCTSRPYKYIFGWHESTKQAVNRTFHRIYT